jgi:hypothetical protein
MLVLETPAGNIKELVNLDAHPVDVSLAIKNLIARTTKKVFLTSASSSLAMVLLKMMDSKCTCCFKMVGRGVLMIQH